VIAKQLNDGVVCDALLSLHKARGALTADRRVVPPGLPADAAGAGPQTHRRPILHWFSYYGTVILVRCSGGPAFRISARGNRPGIFVRRSGRSTRATTTCCFNSTPTWPSAAGAGVLHIGDALQDYLMQDGD